MFGNDPQCRAPNSGRRKVWSIEGIKQPLQHSYNELLFISAKVISFMVQNEPKTEHKTHTSPIRNTPDKLSSVLNNRTLRDITNLLDPYKRTPSETPITTITHILHCYDRTHKILQTLDLDSQRNA